MAGADTLDDALDRLSGTGPEFEGFLSNHAPMTADALIRLGRADLVGSWLDDYRWKLEEAPPERFPIDPEDWREMLGDPSRLGDWCALFSRLVREGSWQDLLAQWWPRLAPGGVAAATHCLIRTGHVVRALSEQETPQRLDEFGRALGYWAARWQPLPAPAPRGSLDPATALAAVPSVGRTGGTRTRLADVEQSSEWADGVATLAAPSSVAAVPAALDALVDATVTGYGLWGQDNPVMLVHAATGPRAIGLLLPQLPASTWPGAYDVAWQIASAITAAFRLPGASHPGRTPTPAAPTTAEEAAALAAATGDEHAIKFTEVALESHRRGNERALASSGLASSLLRG